jgi:hypothetical protein
MFIYSKWDEICKTISLLNKSKTFDNLQLNGDLNDWVAIKHDVETNVKKALIIAKIEARYNIKSTYYFQGGLVDKNYKIIQEISSLGHEIGYHYDVMDANGGNTDAAIHDFQQNIVKFNKYGFDVKTVCPHGNPVMIRNGWASNKDFFRNETVVKLFPEILDIIVQLPDKYNSKYTYISDAGYHWKKIVNIQDNDINNDGDIIINEHNELLELIRSTKNIIISTHPHRWEQSNLIIVIKIVIFKILRLVTRALSHLPIFKNIISKFYFLAKKI